MGQGASPGRLALNVQRMESERHGSEEDPLRARIFLPGNKEPIYIIAQLFYSARGLGKTRKSLRFLMLGGLLYYRAKF